MSSAPVVMVLVDAMRWDYVSSQDMPFLSSLAASGVHIEKLVPSLGFCERAELWTGAPSITTDMFTAITLDWSGSTSLYPLRRFLSSIPWDVPERFNRLLRLIVRKWLDRRGERLPLYQIPFPVLPFCALTEDAVDHRLPGALGVESLFDVASRFGKKVYHDAFTALGRPNGDDKERLRLLQAKLDGDYDLFLLYLSTLDTVAHRYGTQSAELRGALRRTDGLLDGLYRNAQEHCSNPTFVIVGDHGMVDVHVAIDVEFALNRPLREAGLRAGRDYWMFVDSTLVRFWSTNNSARSICRRLLTSAEFDRLGEFLSPAKCRDLGIPAPGGRYGDLIWMVNAGVIIHPSYFHRTQVPLAMHGYNPDHEDQAGCCILSGPALSPRRVSSVHLGSICSLLSQLLGVPAPESSHGFSLTGH